MKIKIILLSLILSGPLMILGTRVENDAPVSRYMSHQQIHDLQEITIPFNIRDNAGKVILSDAINIHVSDSPATITKKLQSLAVKKFEEMSDKGRMKLGGSQDYGLNPQRWLVYQGTKMLKMFSKEQELIDNYDRFDKKYHTMPLTLTYLEI